MMMEPLAKRPRVDLPRPSDDNSTLSLRQLLGDINRALCERLDSIEGHLEAVDQRTKYLEARLDQLVQCVSKESEVAVAPVHCIASAKAGPYPSVRTSSGTIVIGVPQEKSLTDNGDGAIGAILDGTDLNLQTGDGVVQRNVTLITLNSEDDYPDGSWLGDEENLSMRVRVNIAPSDLVHVHSNCRTPEKMALALLDYLFDRDTQASSNLSGLSKHGKRQLDPLLIYGIRCHLIQRFSITDDDWRRIKLNIDSKCRTAYRRKSRGMPLVVKAFRGKSANIQDNTFAGSEEGTTYITMINGDGGDIQAASDDDSYQQDESEEAQNQKTASLLQSVNGGHYQILHATPEQVAQLQQTHQIQILSGDKILAMNGGHDGVWTLTSDGLHVTTEDGQELHLKEEIGVTNEMVEEEEDELIS